MKFPKIDFEFPQRANSSSNVRIAEFMSFGFLTKLNIRNTVAETPTCRTYINSSCIQTEALYPR